MISVTLCYMNIPCSIMIYVSSFEICLKIIYMIDW